MKQFLLFLCLFPVIASPAQSLRLASEPAHAYTVELNSQISNPLVISNVSDKPIRVAVRRVVEQLDRTQRAALCLFGECTQEDQPLELTTLLPGESLEEVAATFSTGFVDRNSTIKYFIYNLDDPQDGFYHTLTYQVVGAFPHGIMFEQGDMKIGNAYPNPATTEASLDYSLASFEGDAQIMVRNLLGHRVLETPLDTHESQLKLPVDQFPDGVYFYSLYLDGKGVVTKKLVVKK